MNFSFTVDASVERTEGKFESREAIENALVEALEGADPGEVEGDNEGKYEVTDWVVDVINQADIHKSKAPKAPPAPAPQPTPFVPLIKAYVRTQVLGAIEPADSVAIVVAHEAKLSAATDTLIEALDALLAHFPKVTEQERAKAIADLGLDG